MGSFYTDICEARRHQQCLPLGWWMVKCLLGRPLFCSGSRESTQRTRTPKGAGDKSLFSLQHRLARGLRCRLALKGVTVPSVASPGREERTSTAQGRTASAAWRQTRCEEAWPSGRPHGAHGRDRHHVLLQCFSLLTPRLPQSPVKPRRWVLMCHGVLWEGPKPHARWPSSFWKWASIIFHCI